MFAVQREEVINFLERFGPSVPNELRKKFKVDTVLMGAVLSELSSRGLLKLTNVKMGSSPFYYLPGQEEQLEKLTQYLNNKDQETVGWLKKVKVAEDASLDTLKRVSLRKIPDFAKQLKARTEDGTEILFWRYFLFGEEEAIDYLRTGGGEQPKEVPLQNVQTPQEIEIEEVPEGEVPFEMKKEKPKQKTLSEENILEQTSGDLKLKESISKQVSKSNEGEQFPQPEFTTTPFYEEVINFFKEHDISIIKQEEISKKEYEFLIKVPSAIGDIIMLSRAKDKKKLNENDVAPALLAAKTIDVSCLMLVKGTFTKKAQKELSNLYTGLIIKKI